MIRTIIRYQKFNLVYLEIVMKLSRLLLSLAFFFYGSNVIAQNVTETSIEEREEVSNWHFMFDLMYSQRSLKGAFINKTVADNGRFGNLFSTGEAMNLDDSYSLMYGIAVQYKKFGLGYTHMPTTFEGEGFALVSAGGMGGGVFAPTRLSTELDVTMDLMQAYYNFVQDKDRVVGIGAGLGITGIDISIIPTVGNPIVYSDTQPFGFLNFHFSDNHDGFLYGFAVNWINAKFQGVDVYYLDYKINLGYRITDGKIKTDANFGYRDVNFAIDIEGSSGDKFISDLDTAGPFASLRIIY